MTKKKIVIDLSKLNRFRSVTDEFWSVPGLSSSERAQMIANECKEYLECEMSAKARSFAYRALQACSDHATVPPPSLVALLKRQLRIPDRARNSRKNEAMFNRAAFAVLVQPDLTPGKLKALLGYDHFEQIKKWLESHEFEDRVNQLRLEVLLSHGILFRAPPHPDTVTDPRMIRRLDALLRWRRSKRRAVKKVLLPRRSF